MSYKRKFLRISTLFLAAALLLTSGALAAFDAAFSYSYPIGNSANYTRMEGKLGTALQKANFIEYTPNNEISPMIVYAGDSIYGSKSTITSAGAYLTKQGYHVIGGINADFFVPGTSVPIGMVIKDGRLVSSDAWQYAVGFRKDGSAIIGQPSTSMKISGASGTVWISYFNKTRTPAGLYLLNRDYSDKTNITSAGKSIVLERLDDTPVAVGGQVKMKVIGKGAGNASTTITPKQMVLTIDDKCQATWVDYPIGEEVTLTVSSPDTRWQNVVYAVGGKSLLKSGAVTASGIDGGSSAMPRTAVAVKDDGTVLLYEIDGRQSSFSAGLTAAQLGTQLKDMGYTNAVCLDGGGSSAMTVRIPGEANAKLISKPSDGAQRACANYIFLVNKAAADGLSKNLHFRPSFYYILPGASTYFTTWASDSSYGPAPLPTDIIYAASAGSIDAKTKTFTADMTPGVVTLGGTSADGTVTGSHRLCVTTAVDSIKLQSAGQAVTSVSLRGGKTMNLDALLYHQNTRMAARDDLLTWTVSGDIGTIDGSGLFTANQKPATGKLICSYGATSVSIPVTVGLSDPQPLTMVADFETTQPLDGGKLALTRVTQFNQVARGTGALAVTLSESERTADLLTPRAVTEQLRYVSLLAKSDVSGISLSAVFTDDADAELETPLTGTVTQNGFTQLSCPIPNNAVALTALRVQSAAAGTLYLDQILMSQRLVNHTDAPVIQLTQSPATAAVGSTATVSARITMENGSYVLRPANVAAYVDGVKSAAAYAPASESITVTTGALTEGLHQVTIDAVDDAGNRSRKSVSITVGNAAASKFADTATSWANGYINFAANRGLITGETVNGITNFNPNRNLKRSEFAVIMARYLNLPVSDNQNLPFADAQSIPSWAAGAIKACYQAGIINGQLDTETNKVRFNPNANITRAEVMTVLSKCLPRGYSVTAAAFTDAAAIPAWAAEHIQYTIAAGLIGGYEDGTIRPLNPITRAEIAKTLCGLY